MKVCKNFIEKQGTSSATICQNCGCEKWEHDVQGKGMLEYIKNMPSPFTMTDEEFRQTYFSDSGKPTINISMGPETKKLFDKALKEEFNKELRKNGFLAFEEFFIESEKNVNKQKE